MAWNRVKQMLKNIICKLFVHISSLICFSRCSQSSGSWWHQEIHLCLFMCSHNLWYSPYC